MNKPPLWFYLHGNQVENEAQLKGDQKTIIMLFSIILTKVINLRKPANTCNSAKRLTPIIMRKDIPFANRVWGPSCKLQITFFPLKFLYAPSGKSLRNSSRIRQKHCPAIFSPLLSDFYVFLTMFCPNWKFYEAV